MNNDNMDSDKKESKNSEIIYEIDGKAFVVGTVYKNRGETVDDILLRLIKADRKIV